MPSPARSPIRPRESFSRSTQETDGTRDFGGLVFNGKRCPPPLWLGKCGNPGSVAGFPSAVGTVEKSGLDFSTVPTARHFHSQPWILTILARMPPWAQPEVHFLIFLKPRQMHIFPDSCGEPHSSKQGGLPCK